LSFGARFECMASPPFRPAALASSALNSWAVPARCAALPPRRPRSRTRAGSIVANPRLFAGAGAAVGFAPPVRASSEETTGTAGRFESLMALSLGEVARLGRSAGSNVATRLVSPASTVCPERPMGSLRFVCAKRRFVGCAVGEGTARAIFSVGPFDE
jgi:hypothetical protein